MRESLDPGHSFMEQERSSTPIQDHSKSAHVTTGEVSPQVKILRPRACRTYARRRLAEAWPSVVEALVTKAEEGSVPHTNLVAKLAGFDFRPQSQQQPKRSGKSFAKQLLEDIDELEARNTAEFGSF